VVRTVWNSSDIWLRRSFALARTDLAHPHWRIHHDEDAELYLNGVLVDRLGGYTTSYVMTALDAPAVAALRPDTNLLAVHVHQTTGGQYIDVGLDEVNDTTMTTQHEASVRRAPFGHTPEGPVELFTITNRQGMEVRAMTYGGIIISLRVPDRAGRLEDVVLGYDSLDGYLRSSPFFGAIVGRYGNRIARGQFTLDGKTYRLATNNGPNHLHGGVKGFDKVVWGAEPFQRGDTVGVRFTHVSPDGDEGYPAALVASVTYTLTEQNELIVDYRATTDRATPVNLTQHSYFNLTGDAQRDILDHELTLDADSFTPVDSTLIPTGVIAPVAGTPLDFRTPVAIGARIDQPNEQLRHGGGYDHNFVLNRAGQNHGASGVAHAAHVVEPTSGRILDIFTTEPGVQFYSGNFLDGSITGKGGRVYRHRWGFCLETQHFPDSPNHPNFPSTILRHGEQYRSTTVFRFSTR
jgi:aldose 1-epimerase